MEVDAAARGHLEADGPIFTRSALALHNDLIHLPSVSGDGERLSSDTPSLASTGMILTFERTGQFNYGLHQNAGSMPLNSRGPLPYEHFLFLGNERSQDIQGEPYGSAGVAHLYQDVTTYPFDPMRNLPHPDGRFRRAHPGQELVVFGESCDLSSGSIRNVETTPASATIKCTASNSFVYRGAPGTDGEIYLGLFGITPDWITAPKFGPAGTFYFYIVNTTSGKQLVARDFAAFGIPAGRFAVTPLEYDLHTHLSNDVAPGDVIRIDIVHQVYSHLKPGTHTIGASAGFAFITTHIA